MAVSVPALVESKSLDEEDLAGLELVNGVEFDTAEERAAYVKDRGWA
ncbi:MAG: hypothetical protein ACT4QD_19445 [Acidobacteriota bacterium]